ncbi:MAG: division/cell wall cluster transcriptional repressor MraZ [Gemmatimonadetes bacterium]|nr:division/cell wall cluster transcriptional repressor MraZ [Gemmatimonadota bacterium]
MRFLGSYLYQFDEKGRIALPAPFRREAPDEPFVLVQPYPPALALYTVTGWRPVEERLQELLRQPNARMWVLSVLSNAHDVAPDAQGRILIPARLKDMAELDSQALLVGAISKIEIWNPARFDKAVREQAGEYGQFASQIFG